MTTGRVSVHTYIAYCPREYGQNLGLAYNSFMEYLRDDDWVVFLDHDAMFTTRDWYHQICEIIKANPDAGLLGVCTNRIGQVKQLVSGIDPNDHDLAHHRQIGKDLQAKFRHVVEECHVPLSGLVMCTSKATWKAAGGFRDGFLGVDNYYQRDVLTRAHKKTFIMRGVYLYHWYRADGDVAHLTAPRAKI